MNDIDELDRLHAAATAGPRRMVFAVRAYDAWPGVSARLRAAEVDAHNLRAMLGRALDEHTAAKAEVERLRGALLPIATGRFASIAEACDIAEDALGAEAVAAWNAAENARVAARVPTRKGAEAMTAPDITTYGRSRNGSGPRMRALTWHNGARVSIDHGEDDALVVEAANQIADLYGKAAGLVETIATLREGLERQRLELERTRALVPPKAPLRIFGRGFVRFDADKTLWLLGKRETGWSSFGFRLDSWDDLFRRYDVRVVECGTDGHGAWWAVEPR